MFNNINRAAGSEPAALSTRFRTSNFKPKTKRKPAYYADYLQFSNSDLIFLTRDWNLLNFVRRLGSRTCLLCEGSPLNYDLRFCYNKEVWVLHNNTQDFNKTLELAREVQKVGSRKVFIIKTDISEAREVSKYD